MKFSALLIACLLVSSLPSLGAEARSVVLFASLVADTPVQLEQGGRWMMDKGDAFPVLMFKEQQTKVVLQLAGTRFIIPADRVRVVEEKDITSEMRAAYRRNVESYLEGEAKKWRESIGAKAE